MECLSDESKKRKVHENSGSDLHASPPSPVAGSSHHLGENSVSAVPTQKDDQLDQLTVLLNGVTEKLDRRVGARDSRKSLSDFSDTHDIADEREVLSVSDSLDAL